MVSVTDRAALIPGHPYIYARHHRTVGLWYVGWHVGNRQYAGSPERAAHRQLRSAYEAAGIAQGDGELIVLWCGGDTSAAARALCRRLEPKYINAFRDTYGSRYVVNRWPFLSDFVLYHWEHDRETHVDRTIDCPYATYFKRQSKLLADERCSYRKGRHYCGEPWGAADPNMWCKVVWPDGTVLFLPEEDGNPYDRFRIHKDETLLAMGVIQ